MLLLLMGSGIYAYAQQDEFNPPNPPEPNVRTRVYLSAYPTDIKPTLTPANGTHAIGASLNLKAGTVTNYTFKYWTLNGIKYSTNNPLTYVVGDTVAYFVAHYEPYPYVNISVSPTNAGTVSSGGQYKPGTRKYISTSAKSNYTFQHWTLNGVVYSTAKYFYYTVGDSTANFVAVYKSDIPEPDPDAPFDPENPPEPDMRYQVRVSTEPQNIASTLKGGGNYPEGRTITVSATQPTGYTFSHWTLNGNKYSNNRSFNYIVGDTTANFVAHFLKNVKITVVAQPTNGGSVSGAGTFTQGTNRTIATTPKAGYTFERWTINGYDYSTEPSFVYTVGDTTAHFMALYHQTTAVDTTTFNPENPPEPMAATTITAVAPEGYYFVSWNDGNTSNPRTVLTKDTALYKPIFAPISFGINDTISICDNEDYYLGDRRLNATGTYIDTLEAINGGDSVVTLFLQVHPTYYFTLVDSIALGQTYDFRGMKLTEPGTYYDSLTTVMGCDSIYRLDLDAAMTIDSAVHIIAHPNDSTLGIVTGMPSAPIYPGNTIVLTAEPVDDCARFVQWSDGEKQAVRTIIAQENAEYIAIFEQIKYTISVKSKPQNYGNVFIHTTQPDD